MTNLSNLLAQYRKIAGLNQDEAANKLGTCKRQLQRYEKDASNIPEEVVLNAAIEYQAPAILTEYTNSRPIGQTFGGLTLDGINQNHVAVLTKYAEELDEALEAVRTLIKITINGAPQESKGGLAILYEQSIADVKTAVTQSENVLMLLLGMDIGIEGHRRHREKCFTKGYKKAKEKPALVAERQAAYKFA